MSKNHITLLLNIGLKMRPFHFLKVIILLSLSCHNILSASHYTNLISCLDEDMPKLLSLSRPDALKEDLSFRQEYNKYGSKTFLNLEESKRKRVLLWGNEANFHLSKKEIFNFRQSLQILTQRSVSLEEAIRSLRHLRTLLLSYNGPVQLNIRIAQEEIVDKWDSERLSYPFPIISKFKTAINTSQQSTLKALHCLEEINYHFVVGRTFWITPQESYQEVRAISLTPSKLFKAGNLSIFRGFLFSPKAEPGQKNGAIVLIPTSGNIENSILQHGEFLTQKGITTFVIDTFFNSSLMGGLKDPFSIYTENEIITAFFARQLLSTHPAVDPERIGIGGFSRGGTIADLTSRHEYYSIYSHDGQPFAFHYAFYPTIFTQQLDLNVAHTPLLYLSGDQDAFVDVTATRAYVERLKNAGHDAKFFVYEGAAHSFETDDGIEGVDDKFPIISMKNSAVAYTLQGFLPLQSRKLDQCIKIPPQSWDTFLDHLTQNVSYGFKYGYHREAAQKVMQDLLRFLVEKGKLTIK
ncbi:hypothetical protein IM40_01710 [Candidatus Paracaedimonas acanthamoebae]|nr:hypothetical protein IM40_01710 [Candidatus Paracaedimonas acanthamoebae]